MRLESRKDGRSGGFCFGGAVLDGMTWHTESVRLRYQLLAEQELSSEATRTEVTCSCPLLGLLCLQLCATRRWHVARAATVGRLLSLQSHDAELPSNRAILAHARTAET